MKELCLSNSITATPLFAETVAAIEELERDRIFCHHDMDHFLDVARIAALMAADEGIVIDRDIIYACALLHDIGRAQQYKDGTEHEKAGVPIAESILKECGCRDEDIRIITDAIKSHGDESVKDDMDLNGLIYRADKASRKCYMCAAADRCHKPERKRVAKIRY